MSTEIINIIHKALNILIALPFALQLWTFIICTSYRRTAANIHTTQREIFRSIKLRFTNSAKLNIPLPDAHSFIAKYFYGNGGPFRFAKRIENLGAITLCGVILTTVALYYRGYMGTTRIIAVMSISFCYYIFRTALSNDKQMELTIIFVTDYLNNTLSHRVSPNKLRGERRTLENPSIDNPKTDEIKTDDDTIHIEQQKKQPVISDHTASVIKQAMQGENSNIIEAVLQEFLA